MSDIDFHIKEIEDIIRYFSTVSPEEKYLNSERRSSLSKQSYIVIGCKK